MLGVPLALLSAHPARPRARLQSRSRHLRVERRLPREDLAGGIAEIGAVEVEADAASQHLYVSFAEAGVGAGRAGLGAVEAGSMHSASVPASTGAGFGLVSIIRWALFISWFLSSSSLTGYWTSTTYGTVITRPP